MHVVIWFSRHLMLNKPELDSFNNCSKLWAAGWSPVSQYLGWLGEGGVLVWWVRVWYKRWFGCELCLVGFYAKGRRTGGVLCYLYLWGGSPSRVSKAQIPEHQKYRKGLPWWLNGKESPYQCRRYGFNPWSRKTSHAMHHDCWTSALEPTSWNYWSFEHEQSVLCNRRSHSNGKPVYHS